MLKIEKIAVAGAKHVPGWGSASLGWLVIMATLALGWSASAYSATSQCFYAEADSYASRQEPSQNFGDAGVMEVTDCCDVGSDTRISYLRFNLDPIPTDATVLSADLSLRLHDISPSDGTTRTHIRAINQWWSENALTWDNRPSVSSTNLDTVDVKDAPRWISWSVDGLVNEWVTGTRGNHGLAAVAGGFSALARFRSKEASDELEQPLLCVKWDLDVEADLAVTAIEVTQGTQDLNNSVRLVAGKPTWVRVHVEDTTRGNFRTFATLTVSNGNDTRILHPLNANAGHIVAQSFPGRHVLNHAFLFRLPTAPEDFTQGTITLTAEVNPVTDWRGRYPPESNFGNNTDSVTVEFEEVPRIGLVAYAADYTVDDGSGDPVNHSTPSSHIDHMISWLERAFPVADIWYTRRRIDLGETDTRVNDNGTLVLDDITSGNVNSRLKSRRSSDRDGDAWSGVVGNDRDIRYYGMVVDSGGFMRGSAPFGGTVGSGPTGSATFGWDEDGSYGDWYGAHELGHNFDRRHAEFCGAGDGRSYPYDLGLISPTGSGNDAIYGFDLAPVDVSGISRELRIYGRNTADVMTYCTNQWISDFTLHGIMDFLQNRIEPMDAAESATRQDVEAIDRLQVVGTIDPDTNETDMQPLFILRDAKDLEPRTPGDYAIVLRDVGGAELARYDFTPEETSSGPTLIPAPEPEEKSLLISELVPYVEGTARVDIEGPSGILSTITAGINPPNIELVSPNGGETLSNDPVEVSWSASDSDGDSLTYRLQFSNDAGASWELVKQNIEATTTQVPRTNLPTTSDGLFRVQASDGIHTASDVSDDTFSLSTLPPTAEIVAPDAGIFVSQDQTLTLEVNAFSPNVGSLVEDQIEWVSSIDGFLGNGKRLSVTGLTTGEHQMEVLVDDGIASVGDSVDPVVVVENPTLLPSLSAGLEHGPDQLTFWPGAGLDTAILTVDNRSSADSIGWSTAIFTFEDAPWIFLDKNTGTTPAQITVSVDPSELEPGLYTGSIRLTNSVNIESKGVTVTLWNFDPGVLADLIFMDAFE